MEVIVSVMGITLHGQVPENHGPVTGIFGGAWTMRPMTGGPNDKADPSSRQILCHREHRFGHMQTKGRANEQPG
jgi:hypothetical protein